MRIERSNGQLIRLEDLLEPMTDDDRQTGPWVLALGTLAIGVGAMATELLRWRRERTGDREPEDEPTAGTHRS